MKCPNCGTEMSLREARDFYESTVFVDQCSECGGIWFDGGELYKIQHGAAQAIDVPNKQIDTDILREPVPIKQTLLCPKDNHPLKVFRDPLFPEGLVVEFCTLCYGMWFNRGEFLNFQDWRTAKDEMQKLHKETYKPSEFDQRIAELFVSLSNHEYKEMRRREEEMAHTIIMLYDLGSAKSLLDFIGRTLFYGIRLFLRNDNESLT